MYCKVMSESFRDLVFNVRSMSDYKSVPVIFEDEGGHDRQILEQEESRFQEVCAHATCSTTHTLWVVV